VCLNYFDSAQSKSFVVDPSHREAGAESHSSTEAFESTELSGAGEGHLRAEDRSAAFAKFGEALETDIRAALQSSHLHRHVVLLNSHWFQQDLKAFSKLLDSIKKSLTGVKVSSVAVLVDEAHRHPHCYPLSLRYLIQSGTHNQRASQKMLKHLFASSRLDLVKKKSGVLFVKNKSKGSAKFDSAI